jgi:DTW domain-containing protein YfiP
MARSVVLHGTTRCGRCQLPLRWCICAAVRPIESALEIDVLIHRREQWKPTSTGRLIHRAIPASRVHVFRDGEPLDDAAMRDRGRERWILHPLGEPLREADLSTRPQVLLLDGSWREATRMLRAVENSGRRVSLAMTGPGRFLLRKKQGEGNYSTAEALLFLLDTLGLETERDALRLQFELHVYAGLRARGEKAAAEKFLAESPVRDALPELIAELNRRRPREVGE